MAETYTNKTTAAPSAHPQATKSVMMPDSHSVSGAQAKAMQLGRAMLCQKADGSVAPFIIDNERSRPGGPIYLIALRP